MNNGPLRWENVQLAIFDLDGTLYDQSRLRAAMLLRLMLATAKSRDTTILRVLKAFRHCREELAEARSPDFTTVQYEVAARRTGCSPDAVRNIVGEWIERRPLNVLRGCRFSGVDRVFAGLAARNTKIAVLSDYPASEKLKALELEADIVAYAGDPDIGYLKPHPAGLQTVLDRAGVAPQAAIMIGDRVERDWAIAQQLGVRGLIKGRPKPGIDTFASYADEVYRPILS